MRDVASLMRSACKAEYELLYPEEAEAMIDRAVAVAMTEPRGPVFLALPREPLAETLSSEGLGGPIRAEAAVPAPAADEALARAAAALKAAQRPLAISARGDAGGAIGHALQSLAEHLSMPVAEFWPTRNVMASDHPLHAGFETGPLIAEADVILVLDSLVPWILNQASPPDGAKVIQLGADPLFTRFPTRGFPVDIALAGDPLETLLALRTRLPAHPERRAEVEAAIAQERAGRMERAAGATSPINPAFVSRAVSEALGRDGVIVNELGVQPAYIDIEGPNHFFGHSLSAGLGWGFPAALGVAHGKPDALVAACVGDGSYMFANPVACGQISEALELPILTVVMHNGVWNAVRRATLSLYPEGAAAKANAMAITSLEPAPDYVMVAQASRGWAARVEEADALADVLAEAVRVVREERRQATVEVIVGY